MRGGGVGGVVLFVCERVCMRARVGERTRADGRARNSKEEKQTTAVCAVYILFLRKRVFRLGGCAWGVHFAADSRAHTLMRTCALTLSHAHTTVQIIMVGFKRQPMRWGLYHLPPGHAQGSWT